MSKARPRETKAMIADLSRSTQIVLVPRVAALFVRGERVFRLAWPEFEKLVLLGFRDPERGRLHMEEMDFTPVADPTADAVPGPK